MKRNRYARRDFAALYEVWRLKSGDRIDAVNGSCKRIERKINRNMLERGLIHGTESHLGGGPKRNVSFRRGAEEILVAPRRDIEAESRKILGRKRGIAHFGIHGLRKSFGKSRDGR